MEVGMEHIGGAGSAGWMVWAGVLGWGFSVCLGVLWLRTRRRLQRTETDLQATRQQATGLSRLLRRADQQHQADWQALADSRQRLEECEHALRQLTECYASERAKGSAQQASDRCSSTVKEEGQTPVPVEDASAIDSAIPGTQGTVGMKPADNQSLPSADGKVLSSADGKVLSPADQQLWDEAQTYIQQHLSRSELSVEEVSKALGVSRVHLYKKLSALTGYAPVEYIRHLRMQQALELLRTTSLPIRDIRQAVGIPNAKLFVRYFKEAFGRYPSECR